MFKFNIYNKYMKIIYWIRPDLNINRDNVVLGLYKNNRLVDYMVKYSSLSSNYGGTSIYNKRFYFTSGDIIRPIEYKEPLGFIPKNIINVYFDLEGINLDNLYDNIGKDGS